MVPSTPITPAQTRRAPRRFAVLYRFASLAAVLAAPTAAFADPSDFGSSFSASSGIAGGSMIQSVGDTTNGVVNLIMGPGMFVVMAIGAVLALFGWAQGKKEALWTGLILFILGAVLRGIWSFI